MTTQDCDRPYIYPVDYAGYEIMMQSRYSCTCAMPGDQLVPLLSDDDPDRQTELLWCDECRGIAPDPIKGEEWAF